MTSVCSRVAPSSVERQRQLEEERELPEADETTQEKTLPPPETDSEQCIQPMQRLYNMSIDKYNKKSLKDVGMTPCQKL